MIIGDRTSIDPSSIDDGENCGRRTQELWEKISSLNAMVDSK